MAGSNRTINSYFTSFTDSWLGVILTRSLRLNDRPNIQPVDSYNTIRRQTDYPIVRNMPVLDKHKPPVVKSIRRCVRQFLNDYVQCIITLDIIKENDIYAQCAKCNKCMLWHAIEEWVRVSSSCPHCRIKIDLNTIPKYRNRKTKHDKTVARSARLAKSNGI